MFCQYFGSNSVRFRSKFKLFDWSTQLKFGPNFPKFSKFAKFGGVRIFLAFESQNLSTAICKSKFARVSLILLATPEIQMS